MVRWGWLLVVGMLVLASEILLRQPVLESRLPEPERFLWHATNVSSKLARLDSWEERSGVDLLFVGDSTVLSGIDPTTFDRARERSTGGRVSFNGALEGLPASGVWDFLRVYRMHSDFEVVIYGLTPPDLNDNSPTMSDVTERVEQAPAMVAANGPVPLSTAARWLIQNSETFRYRSILHETLLQGGRAPSAERIYFDERGYVAGHGSIADMPLEARAHLVNRDGVMNYDPAGRQREALESMIRAQSELDFELILVDMPLADGYEQNFDSLEDLEQYRQVLRAVATDHSVQLWMPLTDGGLELDDRHFADFGHLNAEGASLLTRALATRFLKYRGLDD